MKGNIEGYVKPTFSCLAKRKVCAHIRREKADVARCQQLVNSGREEYGYSLHCSFNFSACLIFFSKQTN